MEDFNCVNAYVASIEEQVVAFNLGAAGCWYDDDDDCCWYNDDCHDLPVWPP